MRALYSLGKCVQARAQTVSSCSGEMRWCATKARSHQDHGTDHSHEKQGITNANHLTEFPDPKSLLHDVISRSLGMSDVNKLVKYNCIQQAGVKKATVTVLWPCKIEEEGYASKKVDAERAAAAAVCQKLKDMGVIGPNNELPRKAARRRRSLLYEGEEDLCEDNVQMPESLPNRHKPLPVTDKNPELAHALSLFPHPKSLLTRVVAVANSTSKVKEFIQFRTSGQRCELTLRWPELMRFTATAKTSAIAEKRAAALACLKFKELELLDENNKPLTHAGYHRELVKEAGEREKRPFLLDVSKHLEDKIKAYLSEYPVDAEVQKLWEDEERAAQEGELEEEDDEDERVTDAITGKPYRPLSAQRAQQLSSYLRQVWENAKTGAGAELPVDAHFQSVLSAVRSSRVVVIAGDTGCGKTTRIPRFLLEDKVREGEGANCNILVTQPRRISAVSVAHRVAQELGPDLKRFVGYQVRLENRPPENSGGALLFLTVGVLLKKLQSNPFLKGVSHVVVDEVHERDINTDLLLALLHTCLDENPDLRVVLMSATGDNHRLSQYFGGCPIVKVPGFMYPVKDRFLEDVLREMGRPLPKERWEEERNETAVDLDLVTDIIEHVDKRGEPGAILCFLPGWQDIKMVQEKLSTKPHFISNKQMILPLHSSLSVAEQQTVFQHPPQGQRKIVLTTNIAETSVTIDDIVHVVDAGMHKEQNYDPKTKVSCLDTVWVSRSNVIQRKGRAGRCQPGHSYHLFSQKELQSMHPFPIPEILRTPLENLVLQAKIHSPDTKAVEFLAQVLDSPDTVAVKDAVQNLEDIGVLDKAENLTPLGKRVACMSCDPRLGKVLVLGAMFRCAQPLLSVAACLTRDPFLSSLQNRALVNQAKESLSESDYSDYLAFSKVIAGWRWLQRDGYRDQRDDYLEKYTLSRTRLRFINGLISQFSDNLCEAELVSRANECQWQSSVCNEHSSENELIKAVLLAGLYPNLIQVRKGFVNKDGRFRPNSLVFKTRTGPVMLHRSTVNRGKDDLPSRWLTFYSAIKSNGQVFIRDSSAVHPLALLLLTDSDIEERVFRGRVMVFFPSHSLVRCEMSRGTWELLWDLRTSVLTMLYRNLSDPTKIGPCSLQDGKLISLLVELLNNTDSNPFAQNSDSEVD